MITLSKQLQKVAATLFKVKKEDWGNEEIEKIITSLSYDDILDFAEYIEASHLSTQLQKECCDVILRMDDVTLYTKKSLIFHMLRFRDPVRRDGALPSYQKEWD